MLSPIVLRYFNPLLHIGIADIKTVYLLSAEPVRLYPEVRSGRLVYRARGSSRRVSYAQLKKGLVKKQTVIVEERPDWF